MDRGAWWASVHGVAKSRTQLGTQQKRCLSYQPLMLGHPAWWWVLRDKIHLERSKTEPQPAYKAWVLICYRISLNFLKWLRTTINTIKWEIGLPWWSSGWGSACQCKGPGFDPWSRRIPHASRQLRSGATATEAWAPQLEKAHTQWPRHSTAKNK